MKKVISDFKMNEEITKKIIKAIKEDNLKEWKKMWRSSTPSSLLELYNEVISEEVAVKLYTKEILNPLFGLVDYPAGFYVTFKEIKKYKLKLQKGSKGLATYKHAYFLKHLTKNEYIGLQKLIDEDKKFAAQFQEMQNGRIKNVFATFKFVNQMGVEKEFNEIIFLKNNVLVYARSQFVLEYLFNIKDISTEIDVKELWNIKDASPFPELKKISIAEKTKNDYIKRAKLKYQEMAQNRACYNPTSHSVLMPLKDSFENIKEYYSTLFHELGHSTGHSSLLNRAGIVMGTHFGSTKYAKEELVAELSSIYTMNSLGILNDDTLKNNMAYLKSWGKSLKEGIEHNIYYTMMSSQKATNCILGIDEIHKGE